MADDTTTREGAEALAKKLTAFWHAQGHMTVQHWIEPQRCTLRAPRGGHTIWVVRSNLVGGQPPRSTDMQPPCIHREITAGAEAQEAACPTTTHHSQGQQGP